MRNHYVEGWWREPGVLPDAEPTWIAPSAGGQMVGVQAGLAVSQGCEVRCLERVMQNYNTVEGSGKDC